jgi:hypothetical protein
MRRLAERPANLRFLAKMWCGADPIQVLGQQFTGSDVKILDNIHSDGPTTFRTA